MMGQSVVHICCKSCQVVGIRLQVDHKADQDERQQACSVVKMFAYTWASPASVQSAGLRLRSPRVKKKKHTAQKNGVVILLSAMRL